MTAHLHVDRLDRWRLIDDHGEVAGPFDYVEQAAQELARRRLGRWYRFSLECGHKRKKAAAGPPFPDRIGCPACAQLVRLPKGQKLPRRTVTSVDPQPVRSAGTHRMDRKQFLKLVPLDEWDRMVAAALKERAARPDYQKLMNKRNPVRRWEPMPQRD